jgi:hypothetical protein
MPTPSPDARAALDLYIQQLADLAEGLALDDFRTRQVLRATRTTWRVRAYIIVASLLFLGFAIFVLFFAQFAFAETLAAAKQQRRYDLWLAAAWALALGGLGSVASIFLHVLKLVPQQTLRTSDEFEVVGRIILGCLFSMILATTLGVSQLAKFFGQLKGGDEYPEGSAILLLPFLAGYSITLVLNLLDKAIRAVELTIGLEDRRSVNPANRNGMTRRGRGRR